MTSTIKAPRRTPDHDLLHLSDMINEFGFTYCYHFPALAAILGMYTLMSNKQYYDALGTTGTIANTEGINSTFDLNSQLVSSIFSR